MEALKDVSETAFQSLWSRAVSFDLSALASVADRHRLNPFRAGRCLSTGKEKAQAIWDLRLNPFRAGRCLSTAGVVWCLDGQGLRRSVPNFFPHAKSKVWI